MNRIKTPLRNRLKPSTQDALIQISMTGPYITDFDPLPAALKWKSEGNRRIRLLHSCTASSGVPSTASSGEPCTASSSEPSTASNSEPSTASSID